MKFWILDKNGDVVNSSTNCKPRLDLNTQTGEIETIRLTARVKEFWCKLVFGDKTLIISSSNFEVDKTSFRLLILSLQPIIDSLRQEVTKISTQEMERTKRLKHNLITHNTMILQEVYNLIPQEVLADKIRDQQEFIQKKIQSQPIQTSQALIRILKNAALTKSEFDVHETLNTPDPILEFDSHRMHKLLKLSLSSFWLDFIEKKINIDFGENSHNVFVDYKTIAATLCHLIDNAVKYILPKTDLYIRITQEKDFVLTELDMISLRIEDEEAERIFDEGYSGKNAIKKNLNGEGIGMYLVKDFISRNRGKIEIIRNVSSRNQKLVEDVTYEQNKFQIYLPKPR